MQQDRVSNPYPWTFEIPLAIFLAVLLVMVLGLHAGRAAANLFAGGGWIWPPTAGLFTGLPGVLSGDAAAGLVDPPSRVATPGALWVWIIVAEVLTLLAVTVLGALGMRRWGPGRLRGMATKAEASALLGQRRLRKNRAVIRPDLYGRAAR